MFSRGKNNNGNGNGNGHRRWRSKGNTSTHKKCNGTLHNGFPCMKDIDPSGGDLCTDCYNGTQWYKSPSFEPQSPPPFGPYETPTFEPQSPPPFGPYETPTFEQLPPPSFERPSPHMQVPETSEYVPGPPPQYGPDDTSPSVQEEYRPPTGQQPLARDSTTQSRGEWDAYQNTDLYSADDQPSTGPYSSTGRQESPALQYPTTDDPFGQMHGLRSTLPPFISQDPAYARPIPRDVPTFQGPSVPFDPSATLPYNEASNTWSTDLAPTNPYQHSQPTSSDQQKLAPSRDVPTTGFAPCPLQGGTAQPISYDQQASGPSSTVPTGQAPLPTNTDGATYPRRYQETYTVDGRSFTAIRTKGIPIASDSIEYNTPSGLRCFYRTGPRSGRDYHRTTTRCSNPANYGSYYCGAKGHNDESNSYYRMTVLTTGRLPPTPGKCAQLTDQPFNRGVRPCGRKTAPGFKYCAEIGQWNHCEENSRIPLPTTQKNPWAPNRHHTPLGEFDKNYPKTS